MADEEEKAEQPIIVKKIVKGGGHHGGAWKVAYADFVTAMMAFFLLMWLLNVTTDEQKNAISNYFDPTSPKVSESSSGAGGVMGGLTMASEGAMVSNKQPINATRPTGSAINNNSAQKTPDGQTRKSNPSVQQPTNTHGEKGKGGHKSHGKTNLEKAKEQIRKDEEAKFEAAKKQIEDAIQKDAQLKELAQNIIIDMTPEGLRIQVVDEKGRPMFASGSARMLEITRQILQKVSTIISKLPNDVSVRGHTDSIPYGIGASYTNWELSTDRANSARRELLKSGYDAKRIHNVIGKASSDPLLPEDPENARNRRISIVLMKEELTNPEAFAKKAENMAGPNANETAPADDSSNEETIDSPMPTQVPIGTFRRTPGAVEFP